MILLLIKNFILLDFVNSDSYFITHKLIRNIKLIYFKNPLFFYKLAMTLISFMKIIYIFYF